MSTCVQNGVTVVLGGQWGDEGKGKLVDILAQEADLVCRCNVSNRKQLHYKLKIRYLYMYRAAIMPATP